eukprot:UN1475
MGLGPYDPDNNDGEDRYHHTVMCASMAMAGGLFQLVVLNLIVNPVYGSEYDTIQQEAELVLQRQRAGYIVMYLLSKRASHSIYLKVTDLCVQIIGHARYWRSGVSAVACLLICVAFVVPLCVLPYLPAVIMAAVVIATGQALLSAVWMHSDWIGDIVGDIVDNNEDSTSKRRFLWVSYRADYDESWCIANDPVDKGDMNLLVKEIQSVKAEIRSVKAEVANLRSAPPGGGKGK